MTRDRQGGGAIIHWIRCALGMHVYDWRAMFFRANATGELVLPAQCTKCGKWVDDL